MVISMSRPQEYHIMSMSNDLRTGRQCCFNLPPHTTFYVAVANTEHWVRMVHVLVNRVEVHPIAGGTPPIQLPAEQDLAQIHANAACVGPIGRLA
ncbi:hypothetical protein M1D80_05445 (plasmid) [Phyllobacteriaceae bacterium JZ32]